ncbi:SLC13 family permease [uncultured Jatrophihabitans sp.]|uniref:SLC13 family permease n=1 Tax=uncultured Jatrophihabitans sp. TaxID=1610747 RepID=UPI0035C98DB0
MSGAPAEVVAAALLLVSLGVAVVRPRGISEAFGALPAAALIVALGIVPWSSAVDTVREIGPTVGFLAAILVFGTLCADAGVFVFLGGVAARASRGRPRRLLALVVALAAAVTATLTLDATVVLLTPVVLTTARQLHVPARPHLYACTRLANSGSLLLPVSNLTNLLAFGAAGLSFGRFTALMLAPWLLVCALEWIALRVAFRRDLTSEGDAVPPPTAVPRYALAVLAVTVALFVVASSLDIAPAWAALAGCLALLAPRMAQRATPSAARVRGLVSAASPGFCVFVLALAVVVDGVTRHGLADGLRNVLPSGVSLPALLAIAGVAAVLANVVNNLPATLALIPLVVGQPAAVLAVLVGVNIGPNATYVGSLATLLWRRLLPARDKPSARQFHALGLTTTPVLLAVAIVALWGSLSVLGT